MIEALLHLLQGKLEGEGIVFLDPLSPRSLEPII